VRRRRKTHYADLILPIAVLGSVIVYRNPGLVDKTLQIMLVVSVVGVCCYAIYNLTTRSKVNIRTSKQLPVPNSYIPDDTSIRVGQEAANNKTDKPNKWSIDLINSLEWKRFEELCLNYFIEKGYKAEVTRQGADGGVDINLFKNSYSMSKPFGIVQCKAWKTYRVGVKPVRELFGVMAADGAPLGVFITSGDYTKEAREFSADKHIKLMNGTELLRQITELPEASRIGLLDRVTRGDYTTPSCPSCGIKMITRTTRKGSNVGKKFWGCRYYPKCRNTLRIRN